MQTEEYISESTIDSPPMDIPDGDEEQTEMFEKNTIEAVNQSLEPQERKFGVELTLKLKASDEKTHTIPILAQVLRGAIVGEALQLSFNSRRFRKILDAILDLPESKSEVTQDKLF